MARIARARLGRGVYHVVNRATGRTWILEEPEAKAAFVDHLARFAAERSFVVYHWCVMANHFHLAVEVLHVEDLTYVVGQASRRFALWHHRRHGGSGALWQGRFGSIHVEKAGYLGRLGHYIERNPLAAGVEGVVEASDYRWSSARAYVHGADDPLIDVADHPEWERMGQTDAERRACYARNLLTDRERAEERRLFSGEAGQVVGSDSFLLQARCQQGRPNSRSRGQPRKPPPS